MSRLDTTAAQPGDMHQPESPAEDSDSGVHSSSFQHAPAAAGGSQSRAPPSTAAADHSSHGAPPSNRRRWFSPPPSPPQQAGEELFRGRAAALKKIHSATEMTSMVTPLFEARAACHEWSSPPAQLDGSTNFAGGKGPLQAVVGNARPVWKSMGDMGELEIREYLGN